MESAVLCPYRAHAADLFIRPVPNELAVFADREVRAAMYKQSFFTSLDTKLVQ
jgi:hypothetical protein